MISVYTYYMKTKSAQKPYLLQFLPPQMAHLALTKTTLFHGKRLRNPYLIDYMNDLLLKFYYRKSDEFKLLSTITKERYGQDYKYYTQYLVEMGYITMIRNYLAGVRSRTYRLSADITNQVIPRFKNTDTILLKKYKAFNEKVLNKADGLILKEVKTKMITDAKRVGIDYDRAISILNGITDFDTKIHAYNINRQCIEKINQSQIYCHFDDYGRMHTNFTVLKSSIRKTCLHINNEPLSEVDIDNSQPLFLMKIISDMKPIGIDVNEFKLFKVLTTTGRFYRHIMNQSVIKEKKVAKTLVYKVFFGKNYSNKADNIFKSIFPTIHNFIKEYKKQNLFNLELEDQYKVLSHQLQRSESNLIYNVIVKEIMDKHPEIPLITIHDSIMFTRKHTEIVSEIFERNIKKEFNIS